MPHFDRGHSPCTSTEQFEACISSNPKVLPSLLREEIEATCGDKTIKRNFSHLKSPLEDLPIVPDVQQTQTPLPVYKLACVTTGMPILKSCLCRPTRIQKPPVDSTISFSKLSCRSPPELSHQSTTNTNVHS